jgi:transposase-like protein
MAGPPSLRGSVLGSHDLCRHEEAARKLIYLAIVNAAPAWTRTRNWTTALLAFKIHFGDRLPE